MACVGLCAAAQPTPSSTSTAQADTAAHAAPSRVGVTGMPTLSFDRSRGAGFGAMGMVFFPLGNKPGTPPSRAALNAQVSTNGSWFGFAFAQLYMPGDWMRLSIGGGYMDSRFQTWVDTGVGTSVEVPFDSRGPMLFAAPLVRVWEKLYVGPTVHFSRMKVKFTPDGQPSYSEYNRSNSLGAAVVWDSRDNQYEPSKGFTSNLRFGANPAWMANDSTFNKLFFYTNYYHRFSPKMILASRVAANIGLGSVPFTSQSYVGNTDIRGYTKGEYRGNQTYAAQSELRWNFHGRWGCVGFFGLAMTLDPTSQLLPGGGAGIRYEILRKYHINAGVDGAVGKNDWGVYFRLTEAF